MKDRPDAYDPSRIEAQVYGRWESDGAFRSLPGKDRTHFCIVIPPPNVTGALHMGHALNNSLQDVIIRYHRMLGENTLWLPGVDHAGVATQSVVERTLWEEDGKTRYDVGREALLERIWAWKERFGGRIVDQLKILGCSCDWERTRFTMDEGLSKAVRTVFVRLYHEGLVYRGTRLVNWCPNHRTALSNDELVYKEIRGHFWHIRYPLADDPSRGVVVATTRPETMLGDTAVAVHPRDGRYSDIRGRHVVLPLTGRTIPVVEDEILPDPERGTGAVKVTPGHDPNDYACGVRLGLPMINILEQDGRLNRNVPEQYRGLDRFEARRRVVEDLEKQGLLLETEDHAHEVAHCYRCSDVIEPYLSDQWFVKMQPLVALARKAGVDGLVRFHPPSRLKQYLDWLDTTPDWCISRQIWWGHRIPVWYCPSCDPSVRIDDHGEIVRLTEDQRDPSAMNAAVDPVVPGAQDPMEDPGACPACGGALEQDPDVLDTWFSSQLWPLSTLGWPDETDDLAAYYPTNVLVTARDIIALWVARMVMMGMKFRGAQPFHDVYVHGTILDETGDIMSKSRGNGFDPVKLIQGGEDTLVDRRKDPPEERREHYKAYGTDAVRYGVLSMATAGQDIRLVVSREGRSDGSWDVEVPRFEEGRRFCNKIWQVTRGVVLPRSEGMTPASGPSPFLLDRWMTSRLAEGIDAVTGHLEDYEIGDACSVFYHLFWDDFCSWYVEMAKPRLWGDDAGARSHAQTTMLETLTALLRLMHPVMPFITESLWQEVTALRRSCGLEDLGDRIITAAWPAAGNLPRDPEAERLVEAVRAAAAAVNNIRGENPSIKENQKLPHVMLAAPLDLMAGIDEMREGFLRFVNAATLTSGSDLSKPDACAAAVAGGMDVWVPLEGLVDAVAEMARLEKRIAAAGKKLETVERKLANDKFLAKAPEEIVAKERGKRDELLQTIEKLRASLDALSLSPPLS
ncbi:MAG: valine--tRNA ligase [Deltaproteobacteria bacterium]|nr:valine--tRNA ligase [Deltaproteobacteria bacterium]